jgi:hypothetical protein
MFVRAGVLALLTPVVLAMGCASAPVAAPEPSALSRFSLTPIDVNVQPAKVVDRRVFPAPADDRVVMPDDFFSPSITDILSRRLNAGRVPDGSEQIIEILEAHTEMRRLDGHPPLGFPTGYYYRSGSREFDPAYGGSSLRGIAAGALGAAIGAAIGEAILDSMREARKESKSGSTGPIPPVFVYETTLRVRMNSREYASMSVTQSRGKDHEFQARDSVDRAIKRLSERIRLE